MINHAFFCSRAKEMARFMAARHDIYLRRKEGRPGPWTTDGILQNFRFCNVFRELDTVTQWINEHIRVPYADHPQLWFMLCIARYINWPPALAELIDGRDTWPDDERFCPERLTYALEERAARGEKVYTGAYMIRAESSPKAPWYSWTKHRYIAEIVLGRLWEDRAEWMEYLVREDCPGCPGNTLPAMECVWDKFQQPRYIGWGPFMAYEVVTDMRHTHYLRNAPDIYTWANAGPGAIRGLNRLFGRDLGVQPPKHQTNTEMVELMMLLNGYDEPYFNKVFGLPGWAGPRFEMRDVEHSLCEWDKMERVRLGQGKMRCKYDWRKATDLS